MGSQKPILGGYKADLVAVILDRECAQQLALALAWALGSTGGGKSQTKGGYPGGKAEESLGKLKPVDELKQAGASKQVTAKKPSAAASVAPAKKAGAKKTAAKKAGTKKPGGSK